MNRADFGTWGIDLPDRAFSRALAAWGVIAAQEDGPAGRTLAEYLREVVGDGRRIVEWWLPALDGPPLDAHELADAWDAGIAGGGSVRLELHERTRDPIWVISQLAREGVGTRTVYLRRDDPVTDVGWRWPLRVGAAGAGSEEALARIRARMRDHPWLGRLVRVFEPGPRCDVVDLLLLPSDLSEALAAVVRQTPPYRADCTVVMGRGAGRSERSLAYLHAMRAGVHTSGVALVPPIEDPAEWLLTLVEQLSHNEPLDVALFAASPVRRTPPLLVAARRLVEFSRIATRIRTVGSALRRSRAARAGVRFEEGTPAAERHGSGWRPIGEVAARMEHASDDDFTHETEMASVGAEVVMAAEAAAAEAPDGRPEPRFIQAQVLDLPEETRARAFVRGRTHAIPVRIGPVDAQWLGAQGGAPFPVDELPPERDRHELRVVLSEPNLVPEPRSQFIVLPAEGASTEARFLISIAPTTERVNARILVSYANRVLQTALLQGPAVAADASPDAGEAITLTLEAIVRPVPAALEDRRRFDAALVLNNDTTGVPGVLTLASGHVAFRTVPDLQTEIDWFDRQLTDASRNRRDYAGGLESAAAVDLLRSFALHGALLHQYLVTDTLGDDPLARGERIQIVATKPEARLPVEFVYDRKAPDDGAPLCAGAAEALERGACGTGCPRGQAERTVVCPLGFWGLSRVLERHAHDPRTARQLGAQDFALQAEPLAVRRTLHVLTGGQVAASHRVEDTVPQGVEQVRRAAEAVSQHGAGVVRTWTDWSAGIATEGRSLLVLLVHTDRVSATDTMPQMEIGNGSWLVSARLDETYVRPAPDRAPPIVLLIGCETGAPDVSFLGLASQFRRHGAAIVVSTGSKVHSEQAVPIAEALIEQLAREAAEPDGCFGEAMRAMRRRILARGQVMALTLTAFGDADWRLVP